MPGDLYHNFYQHIIDFCLEMVFFGQKSGHTTTKSLSVTILNFLPEKLIFQRISTFAMACKLKWKQYYWRHWGYLMNQAVIVYGFVISNTIWIFGEGDWLQLWFGSCRFGSTFWFHYHSSLTWFTSRPTVECIQFVYFMLHTLPFIYGQGYFTLGGNSLHYFLWSVNMCRSASWNHHLWCICHWTSIKACLMV